MNTAETTLEFTQIKALLCENALSERAKERLQNLQPFMKESDCIRKMAETTASRNILETCGTPPLTAMKEIEKILSLCKAGSMLTPEQLTQVIQFILSCRRLKNYLKKAEQTGEAIADYGNSISDLAPLHEEIDRCIRNEQVDSEATPALGGLRRKIEAAQQQIKAKLLSILQSKKTCFSDSIVVTRNGRFTLPVKRECQKQVPGTVMSVSGTGGTCFIEPASVTKMQSDLSSIELDEENEVRKVLYILSALVEDNAAEIQLSIEAVETLDVIFAKAKLSVQMDAIAVPIGTGRELKICKGRHPLLSKEDCVPLDFSLGGSFAGVIITGPNTGGKTVALKTVGLLCMMAQSGLHVPAGIGTSLCMNNAFLCDIGDGQSISENLSTFSAHLTNIISILGVATSESLILLDELGSGTDPAEGMGIAVAVLEELQKRGCLFLVTTHYPEVKEWAQKSSGIQNARMAFDRETLRPLYRLELGEAGESCALYIAKRLGLPEHLLERAFYEAYPQNRHQRHEATSPLSALLAGDAPAPKSFSPAPSIQKAVAPPPTSSHATSFRLGDSVMISPENEIGLVFHSSNSRGEVGVQVKGFKKWVNHKRLKLQVAAVELYPDDYDFSIVFDSVENRKAHSKMEKGHRPDLAATYQPGEGI